MPVLDQGNIILHAATSVITSREKVHVKVLWMDCLQGFTVTL